MLATFLNSALNQLRFISSLPTGVHHFNWGTSSILDGHLLVWTSILSAFLASLLTLVILLVDQKFDNSI